MGSILCEHCTAACCRYLAVPLDNPRTARDYDDIRWYLMHQGVTVFVEEGDWYIQFQTRCKNLSPENRCGIYLTRPAICRAYEPGECDYAGGTYGYDHLFTHPGQINDYYRQRTGKELRPPGGEASHPGRKTRKESMPLKLSRPCTVPSVVIASLVSALSAVGGCASASLATNTGERPPEHRWSVEDDQMVHVGENVHFDFVLQDGSGQFVSPREIADYAVLRIGAERQEAEPDETGHFPFQATLEGVKPGEKLEVEAAAYAQRGSRDFMKVRGQWVKTESPYNEPDRKTAGDSLRFTVYQSMVEFSIARPPDDLDLETGVLRLRRLDGSSTSVYIDRLGRPGFAITGPEPDGYYRVTYSPKGLELNPIGGTDAEFTIYDVGGQRHTAFATIETP